MRRAPGRARAGALAAALIALFSPGSKAVDFVWEPADTGRWCAALPPSGPFGPPGFLAPPGGENVPARASGPVCQRLAGTPQAQSLPDWVDIVQGRLAAPAGQTDCSDGSSCSGTVPLELGREPDISFRWGAGESARFTFLPPISGVQLLFSASGAACSGAAQRVTMQPSQLGRCWADIPQGWYVVDPDSAFAEFGGGRIAFGMLVRTYRQGVQASVEHFTLRCSVEPSQLPSGCAAPQTFNYSLADSLQELSRLPLDPADVDLPDPSQCSGSLCTCYAKQSCSATNLCCETAIHDALQHQLGLSMLHAAVEELTQAVPGVQVEQERGIAADPCETYTALHDAPGGGSCRETPPCEYDSAAQKCRFAPRPAAAVPLPRGGKVEAAPTETLALLIGENNSVVLRFDAYEGRPSDTFAKVARILYTTASGGADPPEPSAENVGNGTQSCSGLVGPRWECAPVALTTAGEWRIRARAQVDVRQLGDQVRASILTQSAAWVFAVAAPPPPTGSPTATPSVSPTAQPVVPQTPAPPETPAPTIEGGAVDPCAVFDAAECGQPCERRSDAGTSYCALASELAEPPLVGTAEQRAAAGRREPIGDSSVEAGVEIPVTYTPNFTCPGCECLSPCPAEIRVRGCLQADRAAEMKPPRSVAEGATCLQDSCHCESIAEADWARLGAQGGITVSSKKVDRLEVDAVSIAAFATVRVRVGNLTVTRRTRLGPASAQWFWVRKCAPPPPTPDESGGTGIQVVFILIIVGAVLGMMGLLWWFIRRRNARHDGGGEEEDDVYDVDPGGYGRSVSMGTVGGGARKMEDESIA